MDNKMKNQLNLFLLEEVLVSTYGDIATITKVELKVDIIEKQDTDNIVNQHIDIEFDNGECITIQETEDIYGKILSIFGIQEWLIIEGMVIYEG